MQRVEAWRKTTSRLLALESKGSVAGVEEELCDLVQELSGLYPVRDLQELEIHRFLLDVSRLSLYTPFSIARVAQLCFSIVDQIQPLPQDVEDTLFRFFSDWLSKADPATELLYTLASLKPSYHVPKALCQSVSTMAVEVALPLAVRRAALHCLQALADRKCESGSGEVWPLEALTSHLLQATQCHADTASSAKLVLSQLRAIRALLKAASKESLQPLLPQLLAGLKFFMATGLPGQPASATSLPTAVPAGERRKGERLSKASEGSSSRPRHSCPQQPAAFQPPSTTSTSESEVSDNELQDNISRALASKLRFESLHCLSSVFSAVGPRNTFTYWQSFLPDGPRLPNSSPSLLSCALRDPYHKCRSAALAVMAAMLDGSKRFLAAADDHVSTAVTPFTPFSTHLGAILRELHHRLLLAVSTETQPTVLTRAVRCLAVLASNTPYQQLTSGYASQILSTLQPLSCHKDIDVRVACLTCCGAVLSVAPVLSEVSVWLSDWPWLLVWCAGLLHPRAQPAPHPLLTEALQVLATATKSYSSSLLGHWEHLVELCVHHLATPHKQHSLKLLEELTRASAEWPQALALWARLLDGPLTTILQDTSCFPHSAQACAVLATLSSSVMEQLKAPQRVLAITLPLGLSRDERAPPAVSSSAVRVIGVYCTFPCLREDLAFLQDSQLAILQALESSNQQMRVQASWALANLSEAATAGSVKLGFPALHHILSAALKCLRDKDVVKCSGVRALGNILKSIPDLSEDVAHKVSSQLAHCTSAGTMKLRWNSCYACHSIFKSCLFFPVKFPAATDLLVRALCESVSTCPNYKVCTNASLALSSLTFYTPAQVQLVWSATMDSLEHSLQHHNFPEFKQASNLQIQLCHCICHVLCVHDDLSLIPPKPLTQSAASTLSDCFNSMLAQNEELLQATERKLSSFPAAVQTNGTLKHICDSIALAVT